MAKFTKTTSEQEFLNAADLDERTVELIIVDDQIMGMKIGRTRIAPSKGGTLDLFLETK